MNIAIKLPNDLRGKILSFPFLHALVKEAKKRLNEEEEEVLHLHLISNKNDIDVLNLLPFSAYYHEIEDEDLNSIFTIHRACVGLKIDRTDIFISTTENFVDASIGKNLKAQKRVGFLIGKNSFFLNQRIPYSLNDHQALQIFSLINFFQDGEKPAIPNVCSRDVSPYYADWNIKPYFVINLTLLEKEINPEWKEFVDLFERQNIVFLCDSLDPLTADEVINQFVKNLSSKNNYRFFNSESHIEFAKMITYCWCFVSDDSPLVQLAAYCGASIYHFNRKENQQKFGNQYFIGNITTYKIAEGESDFRYHEAFDDIYEFVRNKSNEALSNLE